MNPENTFENFELKLQQEAPEIIAAMALSDSLQKIWVMNPLQLESVLQESASLMLPYLSEM